MYRSTHYIQIYLLACYLQKIRPASHLESCLEPMPYLTGLRLIPPLPFLSPDKSFFFSHWWSVGKIILQPSTGSSHTKGSERIFFLTYTNGTSSSSSALISTCSSTINGIIVFFLDIPSVLSSFQWMTHPSFSCIKCINCDFSLCRHNWRSCCPFYPPFLPLFQKFHRGLLTYYKNHILTTKFTKYRKVNFDHYVYLIPRICYRGWHLQLHICFHHIA